MDKAWKKRPPLREMVQAYLDIKTDVPAPKKENDFSELIGLLGPIGGA